MVPIVVMVLVLEMFVDSIKHAFITKFNDISPDVYKKYRTLLAMDLVTSRQPNVSCDLIPHVFVYRVSSKFSHSSPTDAHTHTHTHTRTHTHICTHTHTHAHTHTHTNTHTHTHTHTDRPSQIMQILFRDEWVLYHYPWPAW